MPSPTSPLRSPGLAPEPSARLVIVAHARDDIEAALVRNLLADAGIEATVTGASLSGFRAEAPAEVCVVVRAIDEQAARQALNAVRPEIDEADVGDDTGPETEPRGKRAVDSLFAAALSMGIVTTLVSLGWWLADLPGLEASPLDFAFAFGGLALVWLFWRKRRG